MAVTWLLTGRSACAKMQHGDVVLKVPHPAPLASRKVCTAAELSVDDDTSQLLLPVQI